ncbi:MAG: site-2 protease family protein [Planctomycetaceae bacterium]|jgi:membrane-associated protease RseP (regulator of RpoE activity)|nr:site-2 protease family protein [Planctomycetaceae bacterium]
MKDKIQHPPINWKLPLLLFILTWITTTGFRYDGEQDIIRPFVLLILSPLNQELAVEGWSLLMKLLWEGIAFSLPLMTILTCHEFGHYFQTRRYGVYSSLPYFIPLPFVPFGTMGAVIAMDSSIPNRRALFDIGISGPLAGLFPTLFFIYLGVKWSYIVPTEIGSEIVYVQPLLFQYFVHLLYGPIPVDTTLYLHPVAKAGWVGLFLTSFNLMPLGQLDGGHVIYALMKQRAAYLSWLVFYSAVLIVVYLQLWQWTLILVLLLIVGVSHPKTSNDKESLGIVRSIIGWITLMLVVFGLTPTPLKVKDVDPQKTIPAVFCLENDLPIGDTYTFRTINATFSLT